MHSIHERIRIEAPVEHVWAFLCDTSRWHDWDPRSEYSDFSGPVDRVGTTFVETTELLGYEMKGTHEVLEVVPERLLHTRNDFGPTDIYYRFEPEGHATLVAIEGAYELPDNLPEHVRTVMSKTWGERYMRQQLHDFKALAEASVPVSA
jgi:hypothetical protein